VSVESFLPESLIIFTGRSAIDEFYPYKLFAFVSTSSGAEFLPSTIVKENGEVELIDELQNRSFSDTHSSAFLEVRSIAIASVALLLDLSQKRCQNQNLIL
jgi:hypothetical protein